MELFLVQLLVIVLLWAARHHQLESRKNTFECQGGAKVLDQRSLDRFRIPARRDFSLGTNFLIRESRSVQFPFSGQSRAAPLRKLICASNSVATLRFNGFGTSRIFSLIAFQLVHASSIVVSIWVQGPQL